MIVTVRDIAPPVANAGPDQTVNEYIGMQFDGSGSTDDVGIASYVWTFIDGTPKTLDGIAPTYLFSNPGNYSVTLNVSDAAGNWAIDTVTITVRDNTPPTISTVIQSPSGDIDEGQLVEVSANITDAGSGVKNATLIYSNDNGSSWQTPLRMIYNSTSGLYETTILGHVSGTWVKYKIMAYDTAGNLMTENNAGQYYSYQVIPEFTAPYLILLFTLATTLAVATYRKRKSQKRIARYIGTRRAYL
jgi:PKD repeat protein